MTLLQRLMRPAAHVRTVPPWLARHRGFVARLAAGGGVASARLRPASLVLLRRPASTRGETNAVWVAPSWTVRLAPQFTVAALAARTAVDRPAVVRHLVLRGAVPVPAADRHERTLVHSHTRVERTFVRHESHTDVPSVRVLRTTRIERHSAYPRVSVVLPRAPAPAPAPTAAPPTAPSARSAARGVSEVRGPLGLPAVREPLPPQELARVTDHVLAQLDRKVLSFRERHGRI
jgi:hypothetical protein